MRTHEVDGLMSVLEKIRCIRDPEKWLIDNKLMNMIKSENYQMRIQWYFDRFNQEENNVPAGFLTWSFALNEIINWLEYWPRRINRKWSDDISLALLQCKALEERDCGLFWIAKYSLTRAMVDGRIRLEHCLPSKKESEHKEE
jgi:hypothetical protein